MEQQERKGRSWPSGVAAAVVILLVLGVFIWPSHPGVDRAIAQHSQDMVDADLAGDHADVIRMYREPIAVPFMLDQSPEEWITQPARLALADSYRMVGNVAAAREQYLLLLGWSEFQHESYCRLHDLRCDDLTPLIPLARASVHGER